jgi:transcriptional regulator GlxA family with amidase domain
MAFEELDYIAIIGGLLHRGRQIEPELRSYLLAADKAGTRLLGICTGSFVLCRLGLMKEKRCCISWYHYRDFLREFKGTVPVADEMYVVDGNRLTCSGGVGAALAAGFLVARHLGPSYAQKALHIMQIDETRPGATLQPAPPMTISSPDDRVTRALLLMEQHVRKPISVVDVARRVEVSVRTLERLFKRDVGFGPCAAYRRLRITHAALKLRAGHSLPVVAEESGFATLSHFSETFAQIKGHTPSSARRSSLPLGIRRAAPAPASDQPRVF